MDHKRDGPKYKVGDRVKTDNGHKGVIVKRDIDHCLPSGTNAPNCLKVDGWMKKYWWSDGGLTLISPAPTTEPVAQEETKMQAYQGLIWEMDADGQRDKIVSEYGFSAYRTPDEAMMEMWADFKRKNKDAELKNYEVQVVPFGG